MCEFPSCAAAKGFRGWVSAVLLEQPVANTILGQVCGKASRFIRVEYSDILLNFTLSGYRIQWTQDLVFSATVASKCALV